MFCAIADSTVLHRIVSCWDEPRLAGLHCTVLYCTAHITANRKLIFPAIMTHRLNESLYELSVDLHHAPVVLKEELKINKLSMPSMGSIRCLTVFIF